MERNGRVLNALHPGYDELIEKFLAADPLLAMRRAIDARRLVDGATDPVLLVTLGLPGGVRRYVNSREAELSRAGHTVIVLHPEGEELSSRVHLSVSQSGLENLVFRLPDDSHAMRELLTDLHLSAIELHHFVGLPAAVLAIVTGLGVPYSVFVHDYSWICPRVNLVGGNGTYCGEPGIEECERCVQTHGTEMEETLTVAALRARSSSILSRASDVIAPTADVRSRLQRYFPNLRIRVNRWEDEVIPGPPMPARRSGRIRVAVPGAIGIQKGYQVLLDCAQDSVRRNLDLDFAVIGYTLDDAPLLATRRVLITGPYKEEEIGELLEREECQVAFLPSVAPETWCYTLTHVLRSSLPVVAFDIGAVPERLRTMEGADMELLPLATSPSEVNDRLVQFARRLYTTQNSEKVLHD